MARTSTNSSISPFPKRNVENVIPKLEMPAVVANAGGGGKCRHANRKRNGGGRKCPHCNMSNPKNIPDQCWELEKNAADPPMVPLYTLSFVSTSREVEPKSLLDQVYSYRPLSSTRERTTCRP